MKISFPSLTFAPSRGRGLKHQASSFDMTLERKFAPSRGRGLKQIILRAVAEVLVDGELNTFQGVPHAIPEGVKFFVLKA